MNVDYRRLRPGRTRVEDPGKSQHEIGAASTRFADDEHVSRGPQVEIRPAAEVRRSEPRDAHYLSPPRAPLDVS